MAAYYTPPQRSNSGATYNSYSDASRHNRQRPGPDNTDYTPSASFLIFPSPPCAVEPATPDSPYASSISSLPTDVSFITDDRAAFSRRSSFRDISPCRSRVNSSLSQTAGYSTNPVFTTSWDDFGEELARANDAQWRQHTARMVAESFGGSRAGAGATSADDPARQSWFTLNLRQPKDETPTTQKPPPPSSTPELHQQQPLFRLPLLSAVRKVFSIDDDTLQLLARPSPRAHHADLFDASPYAHDKDCHDEKSFSPRVVSMPEDLERPSRSLKHGLNALAESDEQESPFGVRMAVMTLASIVAAAVGSSGKALAAWPRGARD